MKYKLEDVTNEQVRESADASLNRVAVIGCGHVGATSAYALMWGGVASEIVLIDADARRAAGEAMDLQHAVPLGRPVRVWAGDYRDAASPSTASARTPSTVAGRSPDNARRDLRPGLSAAPDGFPA